MHHQTRPQYALVVWPPAATPDDTVVAKIITSHLGVLRNVARRWNAQIDEVSFILDTALPRLIVVEWTSLTGADHLKTLQEAKRIDF